jgi:hypothetical protein
MCVLRLSADNFIHFFLLFQCRLIEINWNQPKTTKKLNDEMNEIGVDLLVMFTSIKQQKKSLIKENFVIKSTSLSVMCRNSHNRPHKSIFSELNAWGFSAAT